MRYSIISISVAIIVAACAPAPTPTPLPTSTPNLDATATAQAQSTATALAANASATAQTQATNDASVHAIETAGARANAERSATAAAQASATAQSVSAMMDTLMKSAKKIHGPDDGILENGVGAFIRERDYNDLLKNFIIEVRFFNPGDGAINPWNYGFGFRRTLGARVNPPQWLLFMRYDKTWFLSVNTTTPAAFRTVQTGRADNFDGSPTGSNHLRLIVNEATGYFFVNGVYITTLDLAQLVEPGTLYIGTGAFGVVFPGLAVPYKESNLYALP